MRPSSSAELSELCRSIKRSFVHLETRDTYGTETEQPHWAKWRRGESDDGAWYAWWLEMLRGHRTAGRTCRRLRVVSEPFSDYQLWTFSHVDEYVDAGEDIRYVPRPKLVTTLLPGSGDFFIFDDELVLFLHYTGDGTNAAYEITQDPRIVRTCREAAETVWEMATPFRDYRSE